MSLTNPLREEPSSTHIKTVRRFKLIGLIAISIASAIARFFKG